MRHDVKIRECKRMREKEDETEGSNCSKVCILESEPTEYPEKMNLRDNVFNGGQGKEKAEVTINAFSTLFSWTKNRMREIKRIDFEAHCFPSRSRRSARAMAQLNNDLKESLEKRRVFHKSGNILGGRPGGAWERKIFPESMMRYLYHAPRNMLRTQGWVRENGRSIFYNPMPHSKMKEHLRYGGHPLIIRGYETDELGFPINPIEVYHVTVD